MRKHFLRCAVLSLVIVAPGCLSFGDCDCDLSEDEKWDKEVAIEKKNRENRIRPNHNNRYIRDVQHRRPAEESVPFPVDD